VRRQSKDRIGSFMTRIPKQRRPALRRTVVPGHPTGLGGRVERSWEALWRFRTPRRKWRRHETLSENCPNTPDKNLQKEPKRFFDFAVFYWFFSW
jgi:hypothetical protein